MNRLKQYLTLGAIVGPLPYNITDGQLIDAVPVMADFNWIVSQVNANAVPGSGGGGGGVPVLFTPTISFGGGSTGITYGTQAGKAILVGSVVFFALYVQLTNKGSSTGQLRINGLPYTINASWGGNNAGPAFADFLTFSGLPLVFLQLGSSQLGVLQVISGSASVACTDANCANNTAIAVSMFYVT